MTFNENFRMILIDIKYEVKIKMIRLLSYISQNHLDNKNNSYLIRII